ncbi:MAG: zinc metallopeptidase [Gammaproteobacteria bacterium]|nr:zinc metallopeptidase [Gammaproteobacteria bacterium]MBV9697950.1 zinc metallopeptidase [Gammaproteobacteria bacterium]
MRWDDLRESSNVEDVRGSTGGRGVKLGVGGTLLALVASYFFGIDPRVILGLMSALPSQSPAPQAVSGVPQDQEGRFIAAVLGETEDTWGTIFQSQGMQYQPPKLVLYRDQMPTACGTGSAAAGPFYCPLDRKVYLDLAFFNQLADEFQAPGQFAQAYVLAHEVGHHVQNLLGIAGRVRAAQERASGSGANQLSVRLELQADCFAGVWARHADQTKHILEQGDVESALRAAAAVGDDTLQKRTRGYVVPDSFTHGTSAERTGWFQRGLNNGTIAGCDTFRDNP